MDVWLGARGGKDVGFALTSIRSSRLSGSEVIGSKPFSSMYFSIRLRSYTRPDFEETTGLIGVVPETGRVGNGQEERKKTKT